MEYENKFGLKIISRIIIKGDHAELLSRLCVSVNEKISSMA
jgi:hypothetical protein